MASADKSIECNAMEIAPIPGIRAIAAIKPRPVDPELTPLFDIESAVRPDDDTYTASGKQAAGAEENDEQDEGEETSEDSSTASHGQPSSTPIDFFA